MGYVVVLDDGETFSDIHGASIVEVPDGAETEEIESFLKDSRDRKENTVCVFREKNGEAEAIVHTSLSVIGRDDA